uniref:G_PROTEIN_RECEP_F1_2 domain-containing protein n=1 Tax=Steinernema glaseri TaxID=37863 RepID=A0A1I7ZSV1_9BILA
MCFLQESGESTRPAEAPPPISAERLVCAANTFPCCSQHSRLLPMANVSDDVPETETFQNDAIAALVIFAWAMIGLSVNIFAIILTWRNKHMANAFGYLCLSHEIGDIGVLLLYAFWAAPTTLFQTNASGYSGKKLGQFGIFMWNVCVYSHLFITINRFLAIFFPFGYRRCFKGFITFGYIAMMWMVAASNIIPYFFENCYFVYIPQLYVWHFASTTCGKALLYNDFLVGIAFMVIMVLIDSLTYCRILIAKRQMQSSSNRREIRFFIQACCQGLLFVCKLFTFYFISTLSEGKWYKFVTSTLVWESAHVFDGIILILFNSEFQRWVTGKASYQSYSANIPVRFSGVFPHGSAIQSRAVLSAYRKTTSKNGISHV